ncbi:tetratricopeptide repeat protein [Ancylostoma duodenale]|uniref:Tetratricopeptide repeat protein n=1 Tax=Ancylostoma duodenale TaxID=51022 RepID=A0A0C2H521_9BILA|nr:tetratricopeptide repeat protein [Ancylostoma duodenale]
MRDADEASIACLELAKEGERFCREGNFSEAIPRFLDAIRLGTNNLSTLSAIYCQLGNAYYSTNDMDNAYVYHSYDAIVARLMHDKLGEAKAYGNMGNVMKMKDKFADALELTRKQLAIANELDDKQCLARAYYNLGTIYHARAKLAVKKSRNEYASRAGDANDGNANADNDDLRAALECYMSSSKYSQSLEDHINVGRLFGCVGNVLYLLRDYRGAIECHEKRLMIASQFGDHIAKYRAYVNLGNAHVLLSEVDKGIECYT